MGEGRLQGAPVALGEGGTRTKGSHRRRGSSGAPWAVTGVFTTWSVRVAHACTRRANCRVNCARCVAHTPACPELRARVTYFHSRSGSQRPWRGRDSARTGGGGTRGPRGAASGAQASS